MTGGRLDCRRFAAIATGVLGWPPARFWAATPAEFWVAFDGWRQAHGIGGGIGRPASPPLSRAELDRLRARHPDR